MENRSKLHIIVATYRPCILVETSSYSDLCGPPVEHMVTYSGLAWRIVLGSGLYDWIYRHFFTLTINYVSSQSITLYVSLHSLLDYECLLFHCDWLGSDLRDGHFFSFRCSLVNIPQLNTQLLNCLLNSFTNESLEFTNELPFVSSGGENSGQHTHLFVFYSVVRCSGNWWVVA
jgi:hypothetical protein